MNTDNKCFSNFLYLTVGCSGSGKTTWAVDFCKKNNIVRLSSDELRGVIGGDESNQEVSGQVFSELRHFVEHLLKQGYDVLVDATNCSKKSRSSFVEIARTLGKPIKTVCFFIDVEVAKKRNKLRARVVPDHVIDRQFSNIEIPSVDEVDFIIFINEKGGTIAEISKY